MQKHKISTAAVIINISWKNERGIDMASLAIANEKIRGYLDDQTTCHDYLVTSNNRLVVHFCLQDMASAITISNEFIKALPKEVDPIREFVRIDSESKLPILGINEVLTHLDGELRRLVQGIQSAVRDLKATRSDKMFKNIDCVLGRKLGDIRTSLKNLI